MANQQKTLSCCLLQGDGSDCFCWRNLASGSISQRNGIVLYSTTSKSSSSSSQVGDSPDDNDDEEEGGGDWWDVDDLEVLQGLGDDFFDDDDDEAEWIPDGEMARRKRKISGPSPAAAAVADTWEQQSASTKKEKSTAPSPYTEEEEELIEAMGGKVKSSSGFHKREEGFLGDSTLQEIATDYSIPVCYLADVLTTWGVPVPINIQDRLGDLVTGEQAFAIVEAVNSLDVADLHDRYSNQSLTQVCDYWDIPITDAFQFAMKEGWSLPFGVQTNLRVEQEEELIRVLSTY